MQICVLELWDERKFLCLKFAKEYACNGSYCHFDLDVDGDMLYVADCNLYAVQCYHLTTTQ